MLSLAAGGYSAVDSEMFGALEKHKGSPTVKNNLINNSKKGHCYRKHIVQFIF